jgi:CheY-like chemotaxis protein
MPSMPRSTVATEAEIDDRDAMATPSGGGSILLVEDEELISMMVSDLLRDEGYTVIETGSAPEALSVLASGQPVDLLLTDVGLPGMNGRELAQEIHRLHPEMPIVLATGYAGGVAKPTDPVGDYMNVIAKPFDLDALIAKVRALLTR